MLKQNSNVLNRAKSPLSKSQQSTFFNKDKPQTFSQMYSPKLKKPLVTNQENMQSNEKNKQPFKCSNSKQLASKLSPNVRKSQLLMNDVKPFVSQDENKNHVKQKENSIKEEKPKEVQEEQQQTQEKQEQLIDKKPDFSENKIFCIKHRQNEVSNICVNPKCQHEVIILCSDCLNEPEGQKHFGNHRESFMSIQKLFELCTTNSCRFKHLFNNQIQNSQQTFQQEKEFHNYINDMEKYTVRYRNHIQKEEQKIDQDFDNIIEQFTADINTLKDQLKLQLRQQLVKFNDIAQTLNTEAQEKYSEKYQNKASKNEFDEFLINIGFNSIEGSKKNYNIKKLLSTISPFLYKTQLGKKPQLNSFNSNNVSPTGSPRMRNRNKSPNTTAFNFNDNLSQTSMNSGNYPKNMFATMKSTQSPQNQTQINNNNTNNNQPKQSLSYLFEEVKFMSLNKPSYKNKGEANLIYRDTLAETRRLFHRMKEQLDNFLDIETFNQNNYEEQMKNKTVNKYTENIKEEQNNDKDANLSKLITLPTQIEHLKSYKTDHLEGILSLKIIEGTDYYLTGSDDKTVKIWNLQDHTLYKTLEFPSEVTALSTLPRNDGTFMYLIGLSNGFSVLTQTFDIYKNYFMEEKSNNLHENKIKDQDNKLQESRVQQPEIKTPMPPTNQLVGLNDGETVVVVSKNHRIMVYNVFTNENPKKYFEHRDQIYCVTLFPNSNYIATGGRDMSIKIFRCIYHKDFKNNALDKLSLDLSIDQAHKSDITALTASAQFNNILVSGAANGEIKIWDSTDGSLLKKIQNPCGWVYKIIMLELDQPLEALAQVKQIKKQQDENLNPTKVQQGLIRLQSPLKKVGPSSIKSKKSDVKSNNSTNLNSQQQVMDKQFQKKINNINLESVNLLTASFDGTLKLWEASSGNSKGEIQNKNYFDCYPFGGLSAYKTTSYYKGGTQKKEQLQIMTTGSKNDPYTNLYILK